MIHLRRLELRDGVGMLEWLNDFEVSNFFSFKNQSHSIETVQAYIQKSHHDDLNKHFAIVNESDEYLGTISLKKIDLYNLNAEYAIAIRRSAWGKGVGTQASKHLINYAIMDLNLHKIYLNVLTSNTNAIRLYENLGFIQNGVFKDHLKKNEVYLDLYYYELILDERN